MLELKNEDGSSLGRTFGGITALEAAQRTLAEFGAGGTVAMIPAATREERVYRLMAVMEDGRIFNSTMILVGEEG